MISRGHDRHSGVSHVADRVLCCLHQVAGDFLAYFLGLFVEHEWGSQVSLFVFLFLYFLFLWVSWVLAVWMTKPKESELAVPRPV